MEQLSLFEKAVLNATDVTGNTSGTYDYFANSLGLTEADMGEMVFAGRGGMVSKWKRKIRFIQQTLKRKGLVKNGNSLGKWQVTQAGKEHLTKAPCRSIKAYFVTKHGIAFWGDANMLPELFDSEIELIITSPPYLLSKDMPYGNIGTNEDDYVSNMLKLADGWVKMLTPTGNIVLNIAGSYKPKTGYQNLHRERLLIAMEDKLGLHLTQTFYWWLPNRLPTGHWVTRLKKHCVPSIESFYVLTLNPKQSKANNQSVLVEYSEKFKNMVKAAAARKPAVCERASGQRVNEESFYFDNGGAIPHNLLISSPEGSGSKYRKFCKANNLPPHPATFPTVLPEFFIQYLTDKEDIVADSFLGSCVTGAAAEKHGRRWVGTELVKEYLDGGMARFS